MKNGSLQKKKDSKYWYAVVSLLVNGKYKTKWISTRKEKKGEANQELRRILTQMEEGAFVDKSKLSFADYMEYWVDNVIKPQIELTTYTSYRNIIETHIAPYFREHNVTLQSLNTLMLQEYVNSKISDNTATKKKCLSANTVKKHYINISKALDYAVKTGLVVTNCAKNVEMPKVQKFVGKFYTVDQLEQLLSFAKGTDIEPAIVIAVHYGLRRGEVLGLRWSDIDFNANTIHICNTRVRVNAEVEKTPKTESSMRTLPLLMSVKKYLFALLKNQKENQLLFGNEYIINDYVCKWNDGRPFKTAFVSSGFKRLAMQNGLPEIRFHDLRHSTASYLLKLGLSMKEIQHWLGHSQISTTMDIYTHIDIQMRNNVGEKIDGLFRSIG